MPLQHHFMWQMPGIYVDMGKEPIPHAHGQGHFCALKTMSMHAGDEG
jgi:hypothetical protein